MSKKVKTVEKKTGFAAIIFFIILILIIPNLYLKAALDRHLEPRLFALTLFLFTILIFTLFGKKTKLNTLDFRILKNPFIIIYFSYIIITGISIFVAVNKFEAVHEFLKLFTFFILFLYILLFIAPSENSKVILTKVVIVLALILSLIGIMQYLKIFEEMGFGIKSAYKVTGNSAHKNLYSQLLFITFSFSLYGLYYFKDIWKKLSFVGALANILLITLLMTRSVWLGIIVASTSTILVFIVSDLRKNFDKEKFKPFFISTGIIVSIAFAVFILISQADSKKTISSHITEGTDFSSGNTYHRLNLWKKSISMAKDNPILGVGAGNWKINIVKKGTSLSSKSGWKNAVRAHSDYLWVLTETGIIGFLLYFLLFLTPLYFVIRYIKKAKDKDKKVFMLILFFVIAGFAVYSVFSFPKERIELQILLNTVFAFAVYEFHKLFEKDNKSTKKIPSKSIGIILLIVVFFAGISSYKRIKAEIGVQKILKFQKQNKNNDVISIVDDIYSPVSTLDYAANSILFYKAVASDKINVPPDKVIDLFLESLKDHPYNIRTLNGLVYIYQKNKNFIEAEKYCKIALEYSPGDINMTINYAKIKEQMFGLDSAYSEILKTKPNYKNKGYKQFISYLLKKKTNIFLKRVQNLKIKNWVVKKVAQNDFFYKIYIKSYKHNTIYEKELLEEALNDIKIKQDISNDSTVQKLIIEYQISL